jgi:hypothetical protein
LNELRSIAFGLCLALACAFGSFVTRPGAAAPPGATAAPAAAAGARGPHGSVTEAMDCGACHTPDSWKTPSASASNAGFDHFRTGFPLTGRHRAVACAECHGARRQITRQCSGCHADAHQGQLGAGCDGCHSAQSWSVTEALARHRRTRLPLTGMHALVECSDCHRSNTERRWTTLAADCFACHEADYRRTDIHPLHLGVAGDPRTPPLSRDCAQCHRAIAWSPAFVNDSLVTGAQRLASAQAHDRLFPLSSGSHRGAECASCHTSPALPRAVRCTGCHAHEETRLAAAHQKVPGFGASCLGCHPGGSVR